MNASAQDFIEHGSSPTASSSRPASFSAKAIARSTGVGVLYMAAAGLAAGFSFDFGMRAAGAWLAIIAALQGAVFATLMVDAVRDAIRRRRPRPAPAGRPRG